MSRLAKKPLLVGPDIKVSIQDQQIHITGPKGTLTQFLPSSIQVVLKDNKIFVNRLNNSRSAKSLHGLVYVLIRNMIEGVSHGFQKTLELVGTGYRVKSQGDKIVLSLGFSHPIEYTPPKGITLTVEGDKIIKVTGIDKQQVGQVAAEIRSFKKPEPYKGKGIRYQGEHIIKKAGKSAKA